MSREKILEQESKYANKNWNVEESPNEHDNAREGFIAGALWATKNCSIPGNNNRFDPKYKPLFRVGRKQGKAVLDATGREVIFFKDCEEQAKLYCDYLNGC